jgi:hypothetical protein
MGKPRNRRALNHLVLAGLLLGGMTGAGAQESPAPVIAQDNDTNTAAAAEPPLTAGTLAPASESATEQVLTAEIGGDKPAAAGRVDNNLEDVRKSLLKLKRDLVILEEDLLFPASSQVAVYLSMDLGEFFQLDSVTLKLNGKEVHHHLYTEKQVDALFRGAVQKLYVGNARQGDNRVTAFFTGRGPSGRDFRRATTVEFEKSFEPTYIELAVSDSESKYQPDFSAQVSD